MTAYYTSYKNILAGKGCTSIKGFCEEMSANTGIPLEDVRLLLISVDPREQGWYDEFVALLNAHKDKAK